MREILQHSAPLEKIKANLTGKVLSTLDELKRKDFDKYVGFYHELGVFLKEGEQIVGGTYQAIRELKDGATVRAQKEQPKKPGEPAKS